MNDSDIPDIDPYIGKMYECKYIGIATNLELIIIVNRDDSRKNRFGDREAIYELYLINSQDHTYCFRHTLEMWLRNNNLREIS